MFRQSLDCCTGQLFLQNYRSGKIVLRGHNLFFLFVPDQICKIMLLTLFCRSVFQTEFCKLLFRRFFCSICCSGQLFLAPDQPYAMTAFLQFDFEEISFISPVRTNSQLIRNWSFCINLVFQIRSPGMYLYKLVAPDNFCI